MKTAILISGHARTFATCLPNQWAMVYRHFSDPHFFVSFVDDEQADSWQGLKKYVGEDKIRFERMKQPDHIPLPHGCPDEKTYTQGRTFMHEPFAISVPPQAVLKQLWHLNRVWELFTGSEVVADFGTAIRCRPDIWFHSFRPTQHVDVEERIDGGAMRLVRSHSLTAYVPWWGRFGGVNDRFAVLGIDSANSYMTTINRLQDYIDCGVALHPESLVAESLKVCFMQTTTALFSTIRLDGTMRGPEIMPWDIAEASINP